MERLIRTYVPIAIGLLLSLLREELGIDIDGEGLIAFVTALTIAVYYGIVAWLERKFPAFGVLLGQKLDEPTPTQ